ncbi:MAG: N(4)-(beta-N-acetylglucosaminyl)-L-asparaginase [Planctomycetes bacterium]|jgi:L-asparaginase/N4-(beta-N-acetylglucosaminyl)-L-asparaginase|nr:N(4)-(beta-N-acetylglucosaminyl)-L-asparaginase [Planctomycetota bacterium]MBT6452380.1 N(4)-(beta-N-acetylglucosaminyl)-L-asparaginase [Planctomycetota bacterium]MBT6541775.1 N(4)-(beta-N-acetylglucosaminyl)-L-asparaginase [Planctomycetota bacterium]MBT6784484.1 N(4)-(beta-N-acetylglucosaminyl)-L-asparaginase [Planctomycetota bacterium]MBT6968229.1 N(4)-(beta-N-acetylglucosaminyl)-L-asparaginase [Planctomycetota bacterium]
MRRRTFLLRGAAAGVGFLASAGVRGQEGSGKAATELPVIISTWPFGKAANLEALQILQSGGTALDAVERGVMTAEANPAISTVGYGGFPNRDGDVELDAAVFDGSTLDGGAVCALTGYRHPVQVARKVMENSPHLILVGDGARSFAKEQGFSDEETLSDGARAAYQKWLKKHPDRLGEPEGHDTLGQVALSSQGSIAAACTTSGMAWKLPGRVGDSPIVGHGLYADDSVGGCVATGMGEEISKVCGSFLVVERMRQGATPEEAIEEALDRILMRKGQNPAVQAAFVALSKSGAWGAGAIGSRFHYALTRGNQTEVIEVKPQMRRG